MIGENKHPHGRFPALCLGKSPGPSADFLPSRLLASQPPHLQHGARAGASLLAASRLPRRPRCPSPSHAATSRFSSHPVPPPPRRLPLSIHATCLRGRGSRGGEGPRQPATTGPSPHAPRPVGFYFRSNAVGGFLAAASPFLPQWYNLLVSDRSLSKDLLKPH